jgi:hypothetical protein
MRILPMLIVATLLLAPRSAHSQAVEIYGSAGPTIVDEGHSVAAGLSFSPNSRLSVLASGERTHVFSGTRRADGFISNFRGGTLYLGSAELRVTPFGRDRFGPYGLTGLAAGISKPNVNEFFPNPVTNEVVAAFLGGGLQAPLGERFRVFADFRMLVGAEGREGIVGVAPVRAGLSFRF